MNQTFMVKPLRVSVRKKVFIGFNLKYVFELLILTDHSLKPTSLYNYPMGFYNEIIHLPCGIKAEPVRKVIWFKRVGENFLKIDYKRSENYTCSKENCHILDVTINEYTEGDYKCRVCNQNGCVNSSLLVVTLLSKSNEK